MSHQSIAADLTLHPEDEVSFECSASDPDNRPLTWTMHVDPPGIVGGFSFEEQGSDVSFTWRVDERNIAEYVHVMFYVTSDGAWHRMGAVDDQKALRSSVLPR